MSLTHEHHPSKTVPKTFLDSFLELPTDLLKTILVTDYASQIRGDKLTTTLPTI
jgi:hypothetical protein